MEALSSPRRDVVCAATPWPSAVYARSPALSVPMSGGSDTPGGDARGTFGTAGKEGGSGDDADADADAAAAGHVHLSPSKRNAMFTDLSTASVLGYCRTFFSLERAFPRLVQSL
jgi:hypothetical protein